MIYNHIVTWTAFAILAMFYIIISIHFLVLKARIQGIASCTRVANVYIVLVGSKIEIEKGGRTNVLSFCFIQTDLH